MKYMNRNVYIKLNIKHIVNAMLKKIDDNKNNKRSHWNTMKHIKYYLIYVRLHLTRL